MNATLAWIIAAVLAAIVMYLVVYWEKKAKAEKKLLNDRWNARQIDRKLEPDWDVTDRIYHDEQKSTARNRQLV